MKVKDNTIAIFKANSFFYSRKFDKVIRLLEPEIFSYRDNFDFYYMLGISYLYHEKIDNADSYLKRAYQLDDENINIIKSLALINLKKGKWDEALKMYLDILDIEPENKTAKSGLNFIRKNVNLNHPVKMINLKMLYPEVKKPGKPLRIILIMFALFFLISVSVILISIIPEKSVRPGMEKYRISGGQPGLIELGTNSRYILTANEIKKSFANAKNFFNQYRDNKALVEINRLINSNASREVKNITQMLKEYVQKPDFSNIKDFFTFTEVKKDPVLYNECYVIWRGKIGNLHISDSDISFDLWVGNSREFEGVVQVILDFAFLLENGQEIEILGQVKYTGENFILKGITIHKILSQE